MSGKIIRVGIAGQGRSGFDIHARWLREAPAQYKIVAVADQMPERREQAVKEFGCRAYADYHELIADSGIDLFVNSLPSNLHPKGTIEALKAGHNVVCEKPLATKVKDFDAVVAAAKKAKRLFAPFQNSRFYPYFEKIREVIASGKLGRVLFIRINASGFARRWDWQTKQEFWGGNLNNTGPHPMDQAIVLFGPKTPKVFARMKSEIGSVGDADDFVLVMLYDKEAPIIEVAVTSYQAYPLGEMYNISGTLGGLTGGPGALKWRYYDPAKAPVLKLHTGWSDNRQYCKETLPWVEESWELPKDVDSFQYNSRAFYNNVHDALTGSADLIVKLAEVRRQIAVLEECHRQNKLPKLAEKYGKG
jgi:predicted dehydrogenase